METCKECGKQMVEIDWCHDCNARHFQQNFNNWTSGNENIDKFIQNTQLSAFWHNKLLEWIPFDRFNDINYIDKGGFSNVYKAKWIDGRILNWNIENQNWNRYHQNEFVALKSLNNSENVTLEYINEITSYHKINEAFIIEIYGITLNPETKNYMIVLQYAEYGNLRNYLIKNYNELNWEKKIYILYTIANGLDQIHKKGLIHRNLHIGNILRSKYETSITDMGLCKPADYNDALDNKVYGVLPYMAPEILKGQNYTKASDIYSFGIIMYEVISGLPPYHNMSHDKNLAVKVCQGFRPRFNIKVPQLILHLIKQCLDADFSTRPTADEIWNILLQWQDYIGDDDTEIYKQTKEAETSILPSTPTQIHPEAIYTSRLLNFDNLPEPKNSDDYYTQYDNIGG
ncbi:hypothetical protein RclHR1_16680003 [Rhizophagus clarus]|uniref:Kinase-like domain-containing protein n=1 Tax=Rhizophagus clarus TaxID=94130 RepID=A0A2Z6QX55_9GLOM|nr:hypothetical protein RclHR1_16680003 [Rhizophagus clarus]GES81928.1 kinase-like domain-containing protein [Rhizophagus clarus]